MAGSTRPQVNKAHKTRFTSKSIHNVANKDSEKDNPQGSKLERNVLKGARAARLQQSKALRDEQRTTLLNEEDNPLDSKLKRNVFKGARAARLQRSKALRDQKRTTLLNEKRTLSHPRTIVLFGLSATVNVNSLEHDLLASLSLSPASASGGDLFPTVVSSEHKLRFNVLKAPYGDLQACMEMAKVADLIAFVASANGERTSDYIDSFGYHCLSVFRSIGLPSTVVLLRDLPSDLKTRQELKGCNINISSEFPDDCKFYLADTKDDILKFGRFMKDQRPVIPHWRNQRSYIAASKVDLVQDESDTGKCTLLITGYIRARNLSVNQLVHISGAGDFQLCKIEILKDPFLLNKKEGRNMMDVEEANDVQVIQSLVPESSRQEPLPVENVPDSLSGEQTWPKKLEMAKGVKNEKQKILKKRSVPQGTSDYQATWIVDYSDEDASKCGGDDDDDGMMLDMEQSGIPGEDVKGFESVEDQRSLDMREYNAMMEHVSTMMDGENMTREQIEDDIRKLKEAHAEDADVPDEVDTPLDIPARRRFAKYRGLKSFETSSWDPKESLPPEYGRILQPNFAIYKKEALAEALKREQNSKECASVGSYARIHVREVPNSVALKICTRANSMPIIACGLFKDESKKSILHFSIKKHDSYTEPIKSKEEFVFHVGFRQFIARPIFSSGSFNSDKSKMERFLHAGRFSIASVYAPLSSFLSLPLIAIKNTDGGACAVAALGTLRSVDPNRIVLKKIILTGYPQRVSKDKSIVRYMFHNSEDVKWFKPVEVFTKGGHRGRVKESVGTHGAMKCIFNGVLGQSDTVCMNLYKRSYPKYIESPYALLD